VHDSKDTTMPDGYLTLSLYKNDRRWRAREGEKKRALAGSRSKVGTVPFLPTGACFAWLGLLHGADGANREIAGFQVRPL
jgi:hypothetical protein